MPEEPFLKELLVQLAKGTIVGIRIILFLLIGYFPVKFSKAM